MTKNISWYLDLLRLFAATAVLIGHAQGYILPGIPKFLASHAEEAVSGFFVLSGFVIMFVLSEKEKKWQVYAKARFFRLYSVAPIALLCTYLADRVGYGLNSTYYDAIPFFDQIDVQEMFSSLTFTNEFWFQHTVFGSNEAYWSLGFEVPYYVAIALFVFLPRKIAVIGTLIWLTLAGPKILLALPLWALGAVTYKAAQSPRLVMSRTAAIASFLCSVLLYAVVKLGFSDYKHALFDLHDLQVSAWSVLYYMGISAAFALNIFSATQIDRTTKIDPPKGTLAIRWLAGGSFTLYLVHQPLLTFVAAAVPNVRSSLVLGGASLIVVVVICYLLAELGERRKKSYERLTYGVLNRLLPRPGIRRANKG